MNKKLRNWFIWGAIVSITFGSLFHFIYEWSNENSVVGIFGAVNESTWEHLKMLFWSGLIFAIIEYNYVGNKFQNYITAKVISLFVGISSIVVIFYTYTGIIGTNYFIMDILTFVIAVLISQYVGYKITTSSKQFSRNVNIISLVALIILILMFVAFSFIPPKIPLFQDPRNGSYGM